MRRRISLLTLLILCSAALVVSCRKETPVASGEVVVHPGATIYVQQCALCHGRGGKGDTYMANPYPYADLTDSRWGYGSSREEIIRTVQNGVARTPMRGYKGALSDEEIGYVVDYILTLK